MAVNTENYTRIRQEAKDFNASLVAVSKIRTPAEILELYNLGHRDFGENYVQELVSKYGQLPKDIRWHFIGHLQSNKVKYIAPFVHLVHGVDRPGLIKELNKQARQHQREIPYLLQVHIAREETKFGFDPSELAEMLLDPSGVQMYPYAKLGGLMGMATFTDDKGIIREEFRALRKLFDTFFVNGNNISAHGDAYYPGKPTLSMGMSADYKIALEEGSNMIRVGSLLFGARPVK